MNRRDVISHFVTWFVTVLAFVLVLTSSAQTIVVTNSNLAITINGKPVFGMAVSPGPPVGATAANGLDGLDELRSGGIQFYRMPLSTLNWKATSNTVSQTMITTNQAAMDWCAAHGMFALVNLNDLSAFTSTDTNTPMLLTNVLNTFKNHPGLGIWKNKDEAWWGGTSEPDLQRGYDIIRVVDANHVVEQTHAPRGTISDLQPYNNAANVLMVDNYPVVVPSGSASNPPITNTQVSQFGDWTAELSQVTAGSRNFWMVEQIAFSGTTPPNHVLVFPTFQQERFMAYEAIVNGARGLMFFGGNIASTLTNSLDAQLGWNWSFWTNTLKPLTLQLATNSPLADALVAPESPSFITMSGTSYPDIEICVRESGTNLYIMATKREGNTVNATFSGLPSWVNSGAVLFESNRTVSISGRQFTDSFAQWDVHAYKFTYTGTGPVFDLMPMSRTNVTNSTSVFTASAIGPGTLTYRWRKNGTPLNDGGNTLGSTTAKLSVSSIALSDAGSYDLVVTGIGSITSSPAAILTVVTDVPPSIVTQPTNQTNYLGNLANFSVTATNVASAAYQWRHNGTNISDNTHVFGAATSSLTVSPIGIADAGTYSVSIANTAGSATSSNATLTVVVPPSTANWITMWNCAPGVNAWSTSNGGANTPNERTIAYNALSNQLYIVQRSGSNPTIYALNATNGTFLYTLNTNGNNFTTYGGNIPLCGIAVSDDGSIYACNNDTAGVGTPTLKMYRWANSNPTTRPQLIYSGDPLGGVNARWGDSFDARGSGTGTVLITDNHQPNSSNNSLTPDIFVLTTTDPQLSTWTGKYFVEDTNNNPSFSSSIGHSLQLDATGTNFWQKHYGQALAKNSYNPSSTNGSSAKWATNYTSWPTNEGPVAYLAASNLVAGINFSGTSGASPDTLELYSVTNFNSPTLLCTANFPANQTANVNRIGQVLMTSNYIFALDANNGMLAFRLTGPTLPSFLSQPQSQTVLTNTTVTLSAVAQGTDTLSYQWKRNGSAISGATTNNYSIASAQTTDAGTYSVVVTNQYGTATSSATVVVMEPPDISTQPTDQTANFGGTFSFSVAATGTPAPTYQWYHNDVAILGATTSAYSKANAQLADAGNYYVILTNIADDITSFEVTLTFPPPVITAQPQNATVLQGNSATFNITAQGATPLSYQWRNNNVPIAGATGSTLTLTNVHTSDAGSYAVVITNNADTTTSAIATLTVVPSPTRLLNISVAIDSTVTTTWNTDVGTSYSLQYKSNLTDAQWTTLSNIAATSTTTSIPDNASANTQRFYQLSSHSRASDIAGFLKTDLLGNSDSYVSESFTRPAAALELVGSVSGNIVTVSDTPNWTANQFVYASGSQSNNCSVRFLSGNAEGRIYPITANSANSLTLNLGADTLTSVQPNDLFAIEPSWTLGTVFPNGQGIFTSPTPGNRFTEILLPSTNSGINLSASAIYFFNAGIWKQVGIGSVNQNDVVLPLNSQFIVRHNVVTNSTLICAGAVVTSKLAVPLLINASTTQDNYVSMARPLAMSLNASGLISSGAFSSSPIPGNRTDELLYFDNSIASRNKSASAIYYYWSNAWRVVGGGTNDVGASQPFGAGTAVIIRKGTNSATTAVWTNSPNW